ncbi:hypothetical protein D3C80_709020 [compost metagenome]
MSLACARPANAVQARAAVISKVRVFISDLQCVRKVSSMCGLSNLPHRASEQSEGVRSSEVLDRTVKRGLTRLNAACREGAILCIS